MSLDVYLKGKGRVTDKSGIFIREDGQTKEISREEWDRRYPDREPAVYYGEDNYVYQANITHNLGEMADAAGLYEYLWRPEEKGITYAIDLIIPLSDRLCTLISEPNYFKKFNPSNGWGDYDGLVSFVKEYLKACIENPEAEIEVSR